MVEYAVLMAVVVGALLAMQIYMKRGVAGRLRGASNTIGEQYDPRNTTGSSTVAVSSSTTTTVLMLTEPELSGGVLCFDADGDGSCDCIDLNEDGDCADTDEFGSVSEAFLNNELTTRTANETVGPLGADLWN